MIKAAIKSLIFVAVITLISFAATLFMQANNDLKIVLTDIEIILSPLATVIIGIFSIILIWLLFKIFNFLIATYHFLNGDETALSRYFDRNREKRGFQALTDGLVALALGEAKTAEAKAARAKKLLRKPEVTNLLSAQAAEQSGDREKALKFYKELLNQERTKFVGIHGIMKQKLEEGDNQTAIELAQRAHLIKPKNQTTLNILFELQIKKNNWEKALEALNALHKSGGLPKDIFIRRTAILNLAKARENLSEENEKIALLANKSAPELIPAAILAAEIYSKKGNKKLATSILRKTWNKSPHPEIAAAFANLEPTESAAKRVDRFKPWIKVHKGTPEAKMLEAELALAAENYPEARKALGDLPESNPSARALTIMAAVERGSGAKEAVVRGWLAKALGAKYGTTWCCEKCNNISSKWEPICTQCGAFDTLKWMETQLPSKIDKSMQLLPLIIGDLELPDTPIEEEKNDP
jgi:HemY protein